MALSGVPLLSGFFSKDEILGSVYKSGEIIPWLLAVITAGLTTFYAFRLLFVAFYGKSRMDKKAEKQTHESPPAMVVAMVILAVLAAVGGLLGLPGFLGLPNFIDEFLQPVFAGSTIAPGATEGVTVDWAMVGISVLAVAVGFFAAYWIYVRRWGLGEQLTKGAQWLYDLVHNKYYVDQGYMSGIVKPLRALAGIFSDVVEERGINRAIDGLAELTGLAGEGLRRLQTGLVRNYALAMLVGVVAVLAYFIIRGILGL
jgi:NADH-quinone oxidoreductase subunit L